jgi:hypothetical protein
MSHSLHGTFRREELGAVMDSCRNLRSIQLGRISLHAIFDVKKSRTTLGVLMSNNPYPIDASEHGRFYCEEVLWHRSKVIVLGPAV